MKSFGIVVIATNSYYVLGIRFIKRFLRYYKGEGIPLFYFFSDRDPRLCLGEEIHNVTWIEQEHLNWVAGTNSKFRNILTCVDICDELYYFDADTNIKPVEFKDWFRGTPLIGGEHYGNRNYLSNGKGFDRNPVGRSYVPLESPFPYTYHYGAFFGGSSESVKIMCTLLAGYQKVDKIRGYEPPVNDESYINHYFHFVPPITVPTEKFEFLISDKGGIGETRNMKLDISKLVKQMQDLKNNVYDIQYGKIVNIE